MPCFAVTYNLTMTDRSDPSQLVDQILQWHLRGTADRMHTVQLLSTLYEKSSKDEKKGICEYLERILRTQPLEGRVVQRVGVNLPPVALIALARFGPPASLPDAVFSRIGIGNVPQMEVWAKELCPVFKYCLFENIDRFPVSVVLHIRACAATYIKLVPPSTAFLDALADLDNALDRVELEKFETSLLDHVHLAEGTRVGPESAPDAPSLDAEIQEALTEAQNYLYGKGQFDPKKAADLLRSSMDETHRKLIRELENLMGKPYQGGEKDGARRHYLYSVGFISSPEEKFLTAVYALISEEASHKLIAPRETVLVLYTTVRGFIHLLCKRLDGRKSVTS
jgi:hypothetical protein